MKYIQRSKWFTFVELLVVMMILVILWVIAFVSFQSYLKSARDGARTSHLKDIETSLDVIAAENGKYPQPSNPVAISYSGVTVWEQWTIWDSVISQLEGFNEIPLDPLTEKEFTYSRLNTKKEYEIATIYERDSLGWVINWNTVYADGNQLAIAYVKWNYNGMLAKATVASTIYVLAVPTIINADLSETDLVNIINNNRLAYKWYNNLPSSYTDTKLKVFGWFDYSPSPFVLYSWPTVPLGRGSIQKLVYNIQQAYTWSTFNNSQWLQEIIQADLSNEELIFDLGSLIVNDILDWNIWPISHWSDVDKNCIKEDIVIWSQVWAWCNSTIWWGSKYELSWVVDWVDCWDYNWWAYNAWGALCYSWPIWAFTWTEKAYMEIVLSASWWVNSMWDSWIDNIWWKLYNWNASKSACRNGYHVPTYSEWVVLEEYFWCATPLVQCPWLWWMWHSSRDKTNNIVNALQLTISWYKSIDGTDSYGRWTHINSTPYWSSTSYPSDTTKAYSLRIEHDDHGFLSLSVLKEYSYVVRCIAD